MFDKLDFDYCSVFTKLNQEQLQSERKSVEQVTNYKQNGSY